MAKWSFAVEGLGCAQSCLRDGQDWAALHFGQADLGDVRRTRRLVELAGAMAQNPNMSLPKQCPDWSDLAGAYRFLSNEAVDPQDVIKPHSKLVRQEALRHPVVLCPCDDTCLDFTTRTDLSGLGQIGNGFGKGLLQHSSLAVLPGSGPGVVENARVLGVLDLAWHAVKKSKKGETRRERQSRWGVSDVWHEAAVAIGPWETAGGAGSMLVHVGDRHADLFRFLRTATDLGHHFVVRAMHDRSVDKPDQVRDGCLPLKLWDKLSNQSVLGTMEVEVKPQRDKGNRIKRQGRMATLQVRVAPVHLPPRLD